MCFVCEVHVYVPGVDLWVMKDEMTGKVKIMNWKKEKVNRIKHSGCIG